jgi:hypothetical protein
MSTNNGTPEVLLVSLSFSLCRQSKQSEEEAERSEDANNAHRGVCHNSYFYFREKIGNKTNDALAELKAYNNAWRSEHNRLTRPWDGDSRLLPAVLSAQYMNMLSVFKEGFPAVRQAFLDVHQDWKLTAAHRMGSLYDADDFPSYDQVAEAIGYDNSMIPLPSAAAFQTLSVISPEIAKEMEASTNAKVQKAFEEGRKQTWTDLFTPVEKIVSTLSKDKPRVFDSLITNLQDILALAPSFNLSGDAQMNEFIAQAKADLAVINPDDLRNDPAIRKSTCKKAEELLSKFGALGIRKFA